MDQRVFKQLDKHLLIRQGDAFNLRFAITDENGETVTDSVAKDVSISLGCLSKKFSDKAVVYNIEDETWEYPLGLQESLTMFPGCHPIQIRVKFRNSGHVMSCSAGAIEIVPTLDREVL